MPEREMEGHEAALGQIKMRLSEYYTDDETTQWLESGHPQLDGVSPLSLIKRGHAMMVLGVIDRLDGDAYI